MTKSNPFCYFKTSPEIIRLALMMYVRFPLSLRDVEDLLHERGIDSSHETIRYWWNRIGPIFAADIKRRRIQSLRFHSNWKWHLDEMFVKVNGETHYLWRAADHEGKVLESVVTKKRDKRAALKLLRKLMQNYGQPKTIVTDKLESYGAAIRNWVYLATKSIADGSTTGPRIHTFPFDDENEPCSASDECEVCRNSPVFTLQFTTTSTRNVTSKADQISKPTAPPLSQNGGNYVRHPPCPHPQFRGWFDLV